MLAKLKSEPIPPQDLIPRSDILNLAFQLEEKGYFKANFLLETIQLLHCVGWMVLAIVLRKMYPFISSICLALGLLMGGWMSHSYDHQRNNILRVFNIYFSTLFLGTSPSWWGSKHARHHLCTNELEGDSDIDLMPVFFLWKPSKEKDSWNR
jgi:fatty acid desaturase